MQNVGTFVISVSLASVLAILLWTVPAWAFGGCTDSPENPSLLLALVGAVAALLPLIRRH
jgi:XrtJ-associated TM-motif-TM protein